MCKIQASFVQRHHLHLVLAFAKRDVHILYTLTHLCTQSQVHTESGGGWRRNCEVPLLAGSQSFRIGMGSRV